MPNDVIYKINEIGNEITIVKNDEIIYRISLVDKSIHLLNLYENMKVSIDENISIAAGMQKYDNPKNDSERIFNNTFDFLFELIKDLNKKILDLRSKTEDSVFK